MFDFLSDIVNKGKCTFGFHDWTIWNYIDDSACKQTHYCKRDDCTGREYRVEHDFNEWDFVAEDSCEQFRICSRCAAKEERTASHTFTEWAYTYTDKCLQEQYCTRCQASNKRDVHVFRQNWKYVKLNSCDQVDECERCGLQDTRIFHEYWTPYQYEESPSTLGGSRTSCLRTRYCERCNQSDEKVIEHNWEKWDHISPNSCDLVHFCANCKAKETRAANLNEHNWAEWKSKSRGSCNLQIRACIKCNYTDERKLPIPIHNWDNNWTINASGNRQRICLNCNQIEIHEKRIEGTLNSFFPTPDFIPLHLKEIRVIEESNEEFAKGFQDPAAVLEILNTCKAQDSTTHEYFYRESCDTPHISGIQYISAGFRRFYNSTGAQQYLQWRQKILQNSEIKTEPTTLFGENAFSYWYNWQNRCEPPDQFRDFRVFVQRHNVIFVVVVRSILGTSEDAVSTQDRANRISRYIDRELRSNAL